MSLSKAPQASGLKQHTLNSYSVWAQSPQSRPQQGLLISKVLRRLCLAFYTSWSLRSMAVAMLLQLSHGCHTA